VASFPRFAESLLVLYSLLERLKQLPCPHCGRYETLIGHGFLVGYAERGSAQVTRGRRFFCSNRGNRGGCGRTVSVLLAEFLVGCMVTVATLWALLCNLAGGRSVERAARRSGWPLSIRSAYRVAGTLVQASLKWRSWLSIRVAAPASDSRHPLAQVQAHLIAALGPDPLIRLQIESNRSPI
jgi:hypothetical protein